MASIPIGGHFAPSSIVGDSALWKNAQNIARKNKASEAINKATPILIPLWTANVWFPKKVASEITSLNHKLILYTTLIKDINNIFKANEKLWKLKTALNVRLNKLKLVFKGQGLGETKWKGWAWKLLRIKLVKLYSIFSIALYKRMFNYYILATKLRSTNKLHKFIIWSGIKINIKVAKLNKDIIKVNEFESDISIECVAT